MALTTGGGASQRRGSWVREHQPKSIGQYSSDHTVFARLLPHQAQSSVLEEQGTVAIKCHRFDQLALLDCAKFEGGGEGCFSTYAPAADAGKYLLEPQTSNILTLDWFMLFAGA